MHRLFPFWLVVVAVGAVFPVVPAVAQDRPAPADSLKRTAIRRLLAVQRTDSLMLAGVEQGLALQPASPGMPPGFVDSLRARIRRDVPQFIERLVPVYDSLYSADEINELLAFYQTRLGQRVIETQPRLMDSILLLSQQWAMEIAGRVLVDLSRQPPKRP
jgi:uncharacterized protein